MTTPYSLESPEASHTNSMTYKRLFTLLAWIQITPSCRQSRRTCSQHHQLQPVPCFLHGYEYVQYYLVRLSLGEKLTTSITRTRMHIATGTEMTTRGAGEDQIPSRQAPGLKYNPLQSSPRKAFCNQFPISAA